MLEHCPFNHGMFRPQVQSEAEEVWLSIGRIFHRLTLTGQVSPLHFYFLFIFQKQIITSTYNCETDRIIVKLSYLLYV
jgi:hypothetical protein